MEVTMKTGGLDLILKALDVSLDRRKIAFAIAGLFLAFLGIYLFQWIGSKVDNDTVRIIFAILGLLIGWAISTIVSGTVAKMSYDELNDRPAQGWSAALSYSLSHWTSLVLSPLSLVIGFILIALVEFVVLLLGRIPYLGELWASILFPVLIVLNIFLILLVYLGWWLVPAIVAGEGSSMIDTLRHAEAAVRRAPGRLLAYLSITIILGVLATLIIVPLIYGATAGTMVVMTKGLGPEQSVKLVMALPDLAVRVLSSGQLGDLWTAGLYYYGYGVDIPFTARIGALLISLVLLIIPVAIAAALFVVFPTACACATYMTVRGAPGPAPAAAAPRVAAVQPPAVLQPPVVPQKRHCANCGAEIGPNDRFCLQCGAMQ
jgi:uncharacterized membrane protein (DUF485 family)